jgi:hypothetical protein
MAALADGGQITAATIRSYRTAISTYHEEHSSAPNPTKTERIAQCMQCIESTKVQRRQAKGKVRSGQRGHGQEDDRDDPTPTMQQRKLLGASVRTTAAALRPNESLGSSHDERAPRTDQVRFWRRK